jgi:hypothetical protein
MNFLDLFTPHHIATLVDWLQEKRELCVEIYIPHGGGSGSYYTVRSLADLKRMLEGIPSREIQITIWKNHTQSEFESDEAEAFLSELKWIYTHADEVMYCSVLKNRNWSESYQNNPDKYAKEVKEWSS